MQLMTESDWTADDADEDSGAKGSQKNAACARWGDEVKHKAENKRLMGSTE